MVHGARFSVGRQEGYRRPPEGESSDGNQKQGSIKRMTMEAGMGGMQSRERGLAPGEGRVGLALIKPELGAARSCTLHPLVPGRGGGNPAGAQPFHRAWTTQAAGQ